MSNIVWELDFYSRPVLDENGKKQWEVLICESPNDIERSPDTLFKYAEYCSSTSVNSLWLREAIERAIAEAGTSPKKIRFFRRQMNNMIVKACEDIGITPLPSRRTYALNQWIETRIDDVYPHEEGYDLKTAQTPSVQYPPLNPIALPDAVKGDRGDKWTLVSLPASAFDEMKEWDIAFEDSFSLSLVNTTPDTIIPGLIVYSPRATPLAAWMSGLEMGYLQLEKSARSQLRLETGLSDSWTLVNLTNKEMVKEAESFETAKEKANGVHFVAVQTEPDSESFAGFWLLKE
ncbi:Tab2/Atab2 family RNA-binding protein [Waterburya agarophytonicola K14]|uniref:Tab2/Atab2 family RNA-binding protein n=1 Tax=Waterburya agarophytonicola KI4 TaxID=2874699 RepID=A0A964BR35_9CYAN|nr:Tab2/Atab2 family RNA-binding protein [Waterburya agarophytonicola]MCC0177684.1 Tab2/Atab2 family RNA-binding protein [Waterburya agarophytonicola KI4]